MDSFKETLLVICLVGGSVLFYALGAKMAHQGEEIIELREQLDGQASVDADLYRMIRRISPRIECPDCERQEHSHADRQENR